MARTGIGRAGLAQACGVGLLAGLGALGGCSSGGASSGSGTTSGVVGIQDAHQVQLCDGTIVDSFTLSVLELSFTDTNGGVHAAFASSTPITIDLLQLHSEMDILGAFQITNGATGIASVSMALEPAGNGMTEAGSGAALALGTSQLAATTVGGAGAVAFTVTFAPPLALQGGTNNVVVFDFRPGDSVACVTSGTGTTYELDPDIVGFVLGAGRGGLPVRALPCTIAAVDCAGDTLRVGVHPFPGNLFEVSIANAQIDGFPLLGSALTCADIAVGAHALLAGQFDAATGVFDATRVFLPGLGAPAGGGGPPAGVPGGPPSGLPGGPGSGGPGSGAPGSGGGARPPHALDLVGTVENLTLQVVTPAVAELDLRSPLGAVTHVVVDATTQLVDLRNPAAGPTPATVADLQDGQFVKVSGLRDPATGAIDPALRVDILR